MSVGSGEHEARQALQDALPEGWSVLHHGGGDLHDRFELVMPDGRVFRVEADGRRLRLLLWTVE